MPDTGSICQSHLEFMKWADDVLLAALTQAPQDHVMQDRGSSFKSLFETLMHVYRGELVWFRRVSGQPDAKLADTDSPTDLNALGQAWPGLHQNWLDWARSLSADDWVKPLPIHTAQGAELALPQWQVVMHVVNHGSYHRGQVATMLRQAGIKPPASDLMLFYRTR